MAYIQNWRGWQSSKFEKQWTSTASLITSFILTFSPKMINELNDKRVTRIYQTELPNFDDEGVTSVL